MRRGKSGTARRTGAGEGADVELELSVDACRLFEALARDGPARGNGTLRRELGLEEPAYDVAAEALVRAGLAGRGAGRGGSLARLGSGASMPTDGARPRARQSPSPAQDDESLPDGGPGQLLAGPGGLFDKIRSHVPTNHGRGQVFERLIKVFLTEDPLFAERFERVYNWSEWPGNRGERDTGIDLVAEESNSGVCAIQCKFYGENEYLPREGINSFLVSSARRPFTLSAVGVDDRALELECRARPCRPAATGAAPRGRRARGQPVRLGAVRPGTAGAADSAPAQERSTASRTRCCRCAEGSRSL